MNLKPASILIIAPVLIAGCTSQLNLRAIADQPLKVTAFSGGRETLTKDIESPSSEQEKLATWLEAHRRGWKRSYITYAPKLLVSGTNFTLNIHTNGLILNLGKAQYEREASMADFMFLLP